MMARRTVEALDHDDLRAIITALRRQQAAFAGDTASFFMDTHLTMAQFRALATIRRHGRQSGRELARRLRVTPGTLVPLVDRLEEHGYIRRVPDLVDRRTTWLEITPKTDRMFERMWGMGAARLARAVRKLIPKDRAELVRLLDQVVTHIESQGEEPTERPASA